MSLVVYLYLRYVLVGVYAKDDTILWITILMLFRVLMGWSQVEMCEVFFFSFWLWFKVSQLLWFLYLIRLAFSLLDLKIFMRLEKLHFLPSRSEFNFYIELLNFQNLTHYIFFYKILIFFLKKIRWVSRCTCTSSQDEHLLSVTGILIQGVVCL